MNRPFSIALADDNPLYLSILKISSDHIIRQLRLSHKQLEALAFILVLQLASLLY